MIKHDSLFVFLCKTSASAAVAAAAMAAVQRSGGDVSQSNVQSSVDISVAVESGGSC